MRASQARTVSTWRGSPLWEAQASAISASPSSNSSAAPVSTRASASKGLMAERP